MIINIVLFVLVIVLGSLAVSTCSDSNKGEDNFEIITVRGIDKIEEHSSTKESFHTDIYYLIYADKGTYRIDIKGVLAKPELMGRLKIDSTYRVETFGINAPMLGVYKNIIAVK